MTSGPDPEIPAVSDGASGPSSGGRSAVGRVTIATIIAAASGYLVLLLAARQLGATGYAVFAVFWAAYGLVTGAQNGQLQETTRTIRAASDTRTARGRPLLVNVGIGAALAVIVAATSPLWSDHVFDQYGALSVALLAVGVASFAVYAHLCGALSGSLSWSPFAVLLSVDALIRLVGAGIAVAFGWGVLAFLVITVVGSVSWIMVLATSSTARRAVGLPGDVDDRRLAGNTLTAMAAALASAVVVMGFPVLINITARADDDSRVVGAVILAVTLTRAPLLVPLNSFQGVLITRFVAARDALLRSLAVPLAAVVVVGAIGAVAAWAIGSWLLTHIFGADFTLGGGTIALFMVGATALGLLTVTGAATLSVGAHRWYAAGWWVAAIACAALLTVPLEVTDRVALSLVVGPLVGACVHLSCLVRA
ncbi:lipopolysaccharide biosynthesis protein [Gordonia sputi]|uniref:lipopolysaccharide biosynthesis protein n=1 Tax=Gordonia sputi TaxID=36823 RepID=UPI00204347BB|nr:polysaccharide biosynthesis protein [Gordonia sputi]MCM3895144.1 polysaccharide biosynthesis protein [Gordonia sputi]